MNSPAGSPPELPNVRLPPSLDRAVAEIAARQRMLNGSAAPAPRQQPQAAMAAPAPLPAQDLSGLEDLLRNITHQIETLRKPGLEQAINALREELGEIGRTLSDAMPRRAIDAIERQIQISTGASPKAARPASTPPRSAASSMGLRKCATRCTD